MPPSSAWEALWLVVLLRRELFHSSVSRFGPASVSPLGSPLCPLEMRGISQPTIAVKHSIADLLDSIENLPLSRRVQ